MGAFSNADRQPVLLWRRATEAANLPVMLLARSNKANLSWSNSDDDDRTPLMQAAIVVSASLLWPNNCSDSLMSLASFLCTRAQFLPASTWSLTDARSMLRTLTIALRCTTLPCTITLVRTCSLCELLDLCNSHVPWYLYSWRTQCQEISASTFNLQLFQRKASDVYSYNCSPLATSSLVQSIPFWRLVYLFQALLVSCWSAKSPLTLSTRMAKLLWKSLWITPTPT